MADTLRIALRGAGQTLITVGVVLLLFCVYELEVTNVVTAGEQRSLAGELSRQWEAPPERPAARVRPVGPPVPADAPAGVPGAVPVAVRTGAGFAVLRIPRFGADWSRVVVEGVAPDDLERGPGHYPGTALPGQVGNVVLSGHRTTHGAPFEDLDRLRPGDAVVLETRDRWYTYRTTGQQVVAPTAIEVTYPVPGRPGLRPTQRLLTMTTCNPKYSAQQRLVLSARLEGVLAKGPGVRPPALAGG